MDYVEIKEELKHLAESDYEEFLLQLGVLLTVSRMAIKTSQKVNNDDGFCYCLDYFYLFKSYLLGIIDKDDFDHYTGNIGLFIKNFKLINKLLRSSGGLVIQIAGNNNIDELLFLVDNIILAGNTLRDRRILHNDYITGIDSLFGGFNVILPRRDLSLVNRNKELEGRAILTRKFKKEK